MEEEPVVVKLQDTIFSSKNFSSYLKPIEFVAAGVEVKTELEAEGAKICINNALVSSLSTAEDENREFKSENTDGSTKYPALPAECKIPITSDSIDSNVTIKEERDSIEEEGFSKLDFHPSVSFESEENNDWNKAHSTSKTNASETCIAYTLVSTLSTAENENREIKSEAIDSLINCPASPESILPETNINDSIYSNVTIKQEQDSEICVEEEGFSELDFSPSVSFKNEDDWNKAHSIMMMNQEANEMVGEEAGVQRASVSSTDAQIFEVEASGPPKTIPPVSSECSVQCPDCSSRFRAKTSLKAHLWKCHGKQFLCLRCTASFSKSDEWELHLASHFNEKIFSCAHCGAEFKGKEELRQHRMGHVNEEKFSCNDCSAVFFESQKLDAHLEANGHSKAVPPVSSECSVQCPECASTCRTKTILKNHLWRCHGKQFLCVRCTASFSNSEEWKLHLATHFNENTFLCAQCGAEFKDEQELRQHRMGHVNEEKFSCNDCSAVFFESQKLDAHLEANGHSKAVPPVSSECSVQCPECASKYQTKTALRTHLRSRHGKEFLCLLCTASFSKSEEWKLHLATHVNEKIFLCAQCGSEFKDKKELWKHRISHGYGKKFSCKHCSAVFFERQKLGPHLATHSDGKPYSCAVCSAVFKDRTKFKLHLIAHVRKNSLSCPHCAATFTTNTDLQNHMQSCASLSQGNLSLQCTDECQSDVPPEQDLNAVEKVSQSSNQLGGNETCSQLPAVALECKSGSLQAVPPVLSKNDFQCLDCGHRYRSKSALQRHLTLSHGKRLMCLHCPAAFHKTDDFISHMVSHTRKNHCLGTSEDLTQRTAGQSITEPSTGGREFETPSSTPSAGKLFACGACSLTFKHSSHLKRHAVIHSTRRSLSCTDCPAVFYQESRLKNHMKVHMQP